MAESGGLAALSRLLFDFWDVVDLVSDLFFDSVESLFCDPSVSLYCLLLRHCITQ